MPDVPVSPPLASTPLRTLIEQRRVLHSQNKQVKFSGEIKWLDNCRDCRKRFPCPDRIAADAELACITEIEKHLEAIRDLHDSHWSPCANHARDALRLIAPTKDDA